MKAVLKIAIAASLAAGAAAQPHNHAHRHQHARKHQHADDKRDLQVEYAYTTETSYVDVTDGSVIDSDKAVEGLADGLYKVVGESTPTSTVPTSTPVPTTTSISTTSVASTSVASTSAAPTTSSTGGEFIEVKIGSSPLSTSSSAAPAATAASSSSSSSSGSSTTGVDSDFPDGKLSCSTFPSDYGAVWLDNTLLSTGWAGYMDVGVGNYEVGQSASITIDIAEPTSGEVKPGYFVGYACPSGYDAAQWPAAQGSSGQSIGGLWCGSDNKLYLTRSNSTKKLCQAGAGNVQVVNELSEDVYICKTWYPGNEGMWLPTHVPAGATVDLYNPYQSESYEWQGATTSAQYYVNKKGLSVDQACVWTPASPYSTSAGNWAPINIGTSVNVDGETFLSIFHNTPTSSAALDFNIAISGSEVSGLPCKYDASSDETTGATNGCTVSPLQKQKSPPSSSERRK